VVESWPNAGIDLQLDVEGGTGRRVGLEHALRAAVRDGRLAPDARLPATRRLAGELGCSRGTVRAAYDQLIAEGYLTARPGSGTTVARMPRSVTTTPAPGEAGPPRHDLRPGSPDVSAFPTSAWLRSTRRALSAAPANAYGAGDPRGRIELRTAVAEYLGRTRGVLARPELIVITTGYAQALGLIARVLADAGPATIAMEDPGAEFHRDVVRRAGVTVVPMPVDASGARTDLLGDVTAVEVMPAHQYPTGATLHPVRRRALTDLARATGGLVIENDYDAEFRYDRQPVGAVQGTAPDHVAYLGTVSKTLGPAVRLGWMVLPPRLLDAVMAAKRYSDRYTGSIGQLTLADLIASHAYDRHVRARRLCYQRRRDLLLDRLRPDGFAVHGSAAGLHALVRLPPGGPTEDDVLRVAAEHGVAVGHLGRCWHQPGDHPQGIIVGYGTPYESAYPAALDALVTVLRSR
jgi:GntR family transcriptional regulator/MocR family aminotransferase